MLLPHLWRLRTLRRLCWRRRATAYPACALLVAQHRRRNVRQHLRPNKSLMRSTMSLVIDLIWRNRGRDSDETGEWSIATA